MTQVTDAKNNLKLSEKLTSKCFKNREVRYDKRYVSKKSRQNF